MDDERLQHAREYAADYERRLIAALRSGEVKANDPGSWITELEASFAAILAGECDHNFTIWQRMNTFLTGECVPLIAMAAHIKESANV